MTALSRSQDRRRRRRRRTAAPFYVPLLALLAVLLSAPAAYGQGFGVYEQGTCAMGRAGTGVASACGDGSSFFYNPAGLAGQEGFTGSLGATLVIAQGGFTDDQTRDETELDNDPIAVPHLYLNYGLSERLSLGLGAYVPYGLGTHWPTEDFDGRFLGYDTSIQSIYVQPTAAYQVIDGDGFGLSVGGGPVVVFGSVELNQRVDLSEQGVVNPQNGEPVLGPDGQQIAFAQLGIPRRTDFADASIEGSGTGFGAHFGVQARIGERLRLGARFLTAVELEYDGDASFEPVGTGLTLSANNPLGLPPGTPVDGLLAAQFDDSGALRAQTGGTAITQPAQFTGGASLETLPGLTLLADYTWTGWSSFDEINLDFENDDLDQRQIENYEDTHAIRLGAEFAVGGAMGAFSDGLTLRGGFSYNTAAAPDETVTPLLPESDRSSFSLGLGYQVMPGVGFDLAYLRLDQNDRRGRVRELPDDFESAGFDPDTNSGLFSFGGHLIGATFTVKL